MSDTDLASDAFLKAASVPLQGWHASGTLDEALRILEADPDVGVRSIFTASSLGDAATVECFLRSDAGLARSNGGPRGWDALTYLCFSRFLRLDPARSEGFVRAAEALLAAGADPNTGWHESSHRPGPVWESAIYGAAGLAHHVELTRLLLSRGADPNDDETPYHAPESYDMDLLRVLVESGKLNEESLGMMLLRKTDTHHAEGLSYLLVQAVDPNRMTRWGRTALHNALLSDNALEMIESLLDHGASPDLVGDSGHGRRGAPRSATGLAARRGRGDVLDAMEGRGLPLRLEGVERLIAACARDDRAQVRSLAASEPGLVADLISEGGEILAEFAGNGNTAGVAHLLDLGVDVSAPHLPGDPYFDVPPGSTALHVAAWRARHETVRLLVERGAPVSGRDARGRTPLMRAVAACVDSYWTSRRSPESVATLLAAGASRDGVISPCGFAEVDALLASH